MAKFRILLVDDDTTLLRFLGEFLMNEGFDVATAPNGSEAMRSAYRFQPDLVVMDVMMPGIDGWEVTSRLRELSEVPIIMVSGKTAEEDKLRGFKLGVDDYVTKPFSFAELSARITSVLHRTRSRSPSSRRVVNIGDMQVDLDRREATRQGVPVPFTPTEFRLLEVMTRQAGQAVAEPALMQAVWGGETGVETVAVRRYIYLLRQKVEPDPANPVHIITVRGYGYRLEF